jgi:hypothetical protein
MKGVKIGIQTWYTSTSLEENFLRFFSKSLELKLLLADYIH